MCCIRGPVVCRFRVRACWQVQQFVYCMRCTFANKHLRLSVIFRITGNHSFVGKVYIYIKKKKNSVINVIQFPKCIFPHKRSITFLKLTRFWRVWRRRFNSCVNDKKKKCGGEHCVSQDIRRQWGASASAISPNSSRRSEGDDLWVFEVTGEEGSHCFTPCWKENTRVSPHFNLMRMEGSVCVFLNFHTYKTCCIPQYKDSKKWGLFTTFRVC